MGVFTDLLSKAKALEAELQKDGTVLVGEAETQIKDLIQNLEHEASKEAGVAEEQAKAAGENPGAGVQTSSDLTA